MDSDFRAISRAIFVTSVFLLFFFQLISDFIAGIYSFGLMGTDLPPELAALILFLTPFLLLLFKNGLSRPALIVLGELILLARAAEVWPGLRWQMLIAGLGTGLFLFFFPALLQRFGQKGGRGIGRRLAVSLLLALVISILLKTLGLTMDLSNEGWFRLLALALALGAAVLYPGTLSKDEPESGEEMEKGQPAGLGKTIVLAMGIMSVFSLIYFAFASPAVIARWTGDPYLLVIIIPTMALAGFLWLLALRIFPGGKHVARISIGITILFILALTALLAANQVKLPADPMAYPLLDPEPSAIWIIALFGVLLLNPILAIDFGLFTEETVRSMPSMRKLGFAFGLGSLFLMLMTLSHVFTSVWAYIDPFIEPLFRGRFWQIHLLIGIVLILCLLAVRRSGLEAREAQGETRAERSAAVLATALAVCIVLGAVILEPGPGEPEPKEGLVVVGYNLRQGYGETNERSHKAQCQLLKELDADVITISESDTARVAGKNFDIVQFLAACLDMHFYAGPKTGTASFGYGILSKYPIENAETWHLYSDAGLQSSDDPAKTSGGDQVALLKAEISSNGQVFNILSVHSDSNPPAEQFTGILEAAKDLDNVVAIGDYNCRMGHECFEIMTQEFEHCAQQIGTPEITEEDIDHIFVSEDIECSDFSYIESTASDHPAVSATVTIR